MKKLILFISLIIISASCGIDESVKVTDNEKEDCCTPETTDENSITSDITCPECGHTATETLPTEVCVIKYNCKNCQAILTPDENDCCVYCTYGTHKCPSMQVE